MAREHVEGHGLPWNEPVSASRTLLGGWKFVTNNQQRGGNVYVAITRGGEVRGGAGSTAR